MMSEIQQCVTIFEILPNEILFDCFRHLNLLDIFYSFDGLNYRLNKLIRNIPLPLYANFQYANKLTFGEFCRTMLLNPKMKGQIYSLHLSDKETYSQIETFISLFSLDEFANLRSLTMTEISDEIIEKLRLILSLIPQLCCLNLINQSSDMKIKLIDLPMSKLQTLSIISTNSPVSSIHETSSIRSLTISRCCVDNDLYQLLKHTPMLKYLNIQYLDNGYSNDMDMSINNPCAVLLKQIVIGNSTCTFENFEIFIKQTPNLESLTISTTDNKDMIYAVEWQHLITVSLPSLVIFKFKFCVTYVDDNYHAILNQFARFQTDFWQEKHWFTEYIRQNKSIFIYTIPYISNTFELTSNTVRYWDYTINNYDDCMSTIKKSKCSSDQEVKKAIIEDVYRYKKWQNMVSAHVLIPNRNVHQFRIAHIGLKKRKRAGTEQCQTVYDQSHYSKFNAFDNVTNLTLNLDILTEDCQYYFSNVTSLTLVPSTKLGNHILRIQHIESLKKIVNLFNLTHLNIEQVHRMENSLVLLEILKESSQLLSMNFILKVVMRFFHDNELCKYLNKMMKKIFLNDNVDYLMRDPEKLKQFYKIFSNIEHLKCEFNFPDNLLLFLTNFPKLSSAKIITTSKHYPRRKSSWFENEARKLNGSIFDINHEPVACFQNQLPEYYKRGISIWIGNKMT